VAGLQQEQKYGHNLRITVFSPWGDKRGRLTRVELGKLKQGRKTRSGCSCFKLTSVGGNRWVKLLSAAPPPQMASGMLSDLNGNYVFAALATKT